MNKRYFFLMVLLIAVVASSSCSQSSGPAGGSQTGAATSSLTGMVSDSMCKADHSPMGEQGKDPAQCAKTCVDGGQKFVLVDSATGKAFELDDQTKAREFAGQKVTVEGTVEGEKLRVARMVAAGS